MPATTAPLALPTPPSPATVPVWLRPPALLGVALLVLVWRAFAISQSGATLYVDEAQYWLWAQDLDWGYFSKPPGIALVIQLSTALFGDGLLGVKALAMLCYPLSALLCWSLARRLYDARVAGWSALLVLSLPLYAWLGLFASTDALLTLFWLLALRLYLQALDHDRWRDWLALGLACGLGLQSKYPMAIFIAALFLHLLCFHRSLLQSARPWLAALLALALFSPNLLWNLAHDFPTLRHTAEITLQRDNGGSLRGLAEFIAAQWLGFGPVLGSLALLALWRGRQLWSEPRARLLWWFALPLWGVVALQALSGGANANWAAPALAPVVITAVAGTLATSSQRLLIIALASNLLLTALAYHAPTLLSAVDHPKTAKINPYQRATSWNDLAEQLRPQLVAHPDAVLLADNRTLLSHLGYELRDRKPQLVSWNPQGIVSDHFRLTTDLRRHPGSPALLVSENPPDPALLAHFSHQQALASLTTPAGLAPARHLEVYLLHGFQGY